MALIKGGDHCPSNHCSANSQLVSCNDGRRPSFRESDDDSGNRSTTNGLQNPHRGFDSRRRLSVEIPSKTKETSARPKQRARSQTLTVVPIRGETSGLTRAEARAYLLRTAR